MLDSKKKLNVPYVCFRISQLSGEKFTWPTLCPLPALVLDVNGRLRPFRFEFTNSNTQQRFKVQVEMRIGGDGVVRADECKMWMDRSN